MVHDGGDGRVPVMSYGGGSADADSSNMQGKMDGDR